MKIRNKEELKYIMDYFGIVKIHLTTKCGDIINSKDGLEYNDYRALRRYSYDSRYMAFEDAIKQINADGEIFDKWKEIEDKIYTTKVLEVNTDWLTDEKEISVRRYNDYYAKSADVKKCHLKVSKDEKGEMVLSGLATDLRNYIRYCNGHLKYCNGLSARFDNEELNDIVKFLRRYDITPKTGRCYEWWHVGIVD